MAALGKIRSKGVFLIIIIGLGLFGFIAGDMFRSCESTGREASNRTAEIFGEKIGAQDYQKYQEEFVECNKLMNPNYNDDQLRQMAWNAFKNNKLFEHECEELGITVTDEEINNIMTAGTHPALQQLAQLGFVNQQTGRFDVNAYKKYITDYNKMRDMGQARDEQSEKLHTLVLFLEKNLRQQLLQSKFQSLAQACVLSNPYEAEFAFNAEKNESNVKLAYFDYKAVPDNDVKVTDEALNKKYNELKGTFYTPYEVRDAKYILVNKVASEADKANLRKALTEAAEALRNTQNVDSVLRTNQSTLSYLGVPVTKNAFTHDISSRLDSMAVGSVNGPIQGFANGIETLSVMKLIGKSTLPDSIEYRIIAFGIDPNTPNMSKDKVEARADSVLNAIVGGAEFDALAKKYNGTDGQKQWLTTAGYEKATSMSKDDMTTFNMLNNMAVNETKKLSLANGAFVIQVTDKRNMVTKYDVAVLQRNVVPSKETSAEIDNKFNLFVSENSSLELMEKNAQKNGYQLLDAKGIVTANMGIPLSNGQTLPNSRDALRWAFDAKKNDVSQIFKCGANQDQKLVMVLTGIYPKGYFTLDNPDVREYVKQRVLVDLKAEKLMAKLKDVKSVEQAEKAGAKVADIEQITLASPVFVSELGQYEPALSGAVAKTAKGQFSSQPVKGNAGVYVFKVNEKTTLPGKFDDNTKKEYMARTQQENMRYLNMQDIELNAEVVDNRYVHF